MSDKYTAAAHAMQSGVAQKMQYDPKETEPKHLRVGINCAMADHGSTVRLLIAKGVFTEDEYTRALEEGMAREVKSYEGELSAHFGVPVTLA